MKKLLSTLLIAAIGGTSAIYVEQKFFAEKNYVSQINNPTPVHFTSAGHTPLNSPDFVQAAEASVNSVVHIKTRIEEKNDQLNYDPFQQLFYGQQQPRVQQGSGSGVIIDKDGYIV
ncbi:MAG: deoxyribonuclease HsdR, partial [Bacteroidia bacterium]